MSKLFKSKFLLGVMVVAAVFAFVGFSNPSQAAADCSITTTLRVGSTGAQVQCLQVALGGLTADGVFGPMTRSAVMSWQAKSGLVADGIFGPKSNAVWMANQGNVGVFPAGCTSAVGFSTTTGMSCATPVAGGFPAGCTSSSGFSVTTGMSCSVVSGLPAGCSSTAGFSPTTGMSCSGGSSPTGPLAGGAGSITVSAKSTYSNEDVIAGDEDAKVLAFEVEADDDSDVEITSVKVELKQTAAGNSDRIEDYMESVSIWMGGEKVGEADADEFTENSDIYTKTISLDGAIVRAGDTEVFVVAVTAQNNLDSGDIDDDAFGVDVLNVRFEDGEGVVTTEDTDGDALDRTFDFDDLATSGELELKLSKGSGNPDAMVVEVDDTTDTDVTMLEFKLKAEGSDMLVDSILLTGTAVGVDNTFADMVSEVSLVMGNDELDSVSAYFDAVDDTTGEMLFDDLDLTIDEGETVTFKVVARIRDIAAGSGVGTAFDQGDSFAVSFTAGNLDDVTGVDSTDVEDENGDSVAAGDRSGSVTGEAQSFFSEGVDMDLGTVTYTETVNAAGAVTKVTYTIPFTVKAFGTNVYIPTSVAAQSSASASAGSNGLNYEIENAADATVAAANVAGSASSITSNATVVGGRYEIADGDNETFSVSISMDAVLAGGAAPAFPAFFRVQLLDLGYSLTSAGAVVNLDLSPETDFDTVDRSLDAV